MWLFETGGLTLEGLETLTAQGGIILYMLAAASIVGLTIIVEKIVRVRRSRVFDENAAVDLLMSIRRGSSEELAEAQRYAPAPMVDIVDAARDVAGLPREEMLDEMKSVASMHIRWLSERFRLLGILASISPLLGLLGTVLGMIRAMGEISAGAEASALVVGRGISQALITTAVGLAIGIPMLFVHTLLKDRVNRYAAELEEFSHEVLKAVRYPEGGSGEQQPKKVVSGRSRENRTAGQDSKNLTAEDESSRRVSRVFGNKLQLTFVEEDDDHRELSVDYSEDPKNREASA